MATVFLMFTDADFEDPHNFDKVILLGATDDGEPDPGHASQQLAAIALIAAKAELERRHAGDN